MPITVVCHKCGTLATVPDSAAGMQGKCERCANVILVPGGIKKICCICRADVSNTQRTKDAAGNYYCTQCAKAKHHAIEASATAEPSATPDPGSASESAICVICKADFPRKSLCSFDGDLVCNACAQHAGLGTASYRTKKMRWSGVRLVYRCPQCQGELESTVDEAGKEDRCPQCGAAFDVPGRYEKLRAGQPATSPANSVRPRFSQPDYSQPQQPSPTPQYPQGVYPPQPGRDYAIPKAPDAMTTPGFWKRYLCIFLDGLVLIIPLSILGAIIGIFSGSAGFTLQGGPSDIVRAVATACISAELAVIAYFWIFHGSLGKTLGKMAGRLRVVNLDGSRISWSKALARAFAYEGGVFLLAVAILIFGPQRPMFYMVAVAFLGSWVLADCFAIFFPDSAPMQRALHDRICGTRVVEEPRVYTR